MQQYVPHCVGSKQVLCTVWSHTNNCVSDNGINDSDLITHIEMLAHVTFAILLLSIHDIVENEFNILPPPTVCDTVLNCLECSAWMDR